MPLKKPFGFSKEVIERTMFEGNVKNQSTLLHYKVAFVQWKGSMDV